MLISFFIQRLVLCLIAGLIFIAAFNRLATSNPKPNEAQHNIKWASVLFYILAGLQFAAFIFWAFNVDAPERQSEPLIPLDGIIRHSHQHIVWGYATQIQRFCLTFFIGTFACVAFAEYFRHFTSSPSTWWGKTLKVIWYIFIWMLYVNCTDFHYFDFPEFVKTILFAVAIWICFSRRQTPKVPNDNPGSKDKSEMNIQPPVIVEPPSELISSASEPHELPRKVVSTSDVESNMNTTTDEQNIRYCTYCGKKIDVDSKFCRFCGKPTHKSLFNSNELKTTFKGLYSKASTIIDFIKSKCWRLRGMFNFSKSTDNLTFDKKLVPISIICTIVGCIGIAAFAYYCVIYDWNVDSFKDYDAHDIWLTFIICSIAIVVLTSIYLLLAKAYNNYKYRIFKWIAKVFATLTIFACIGNVVAVVLTAINFSSYYKVYQYDMAITKPQSQLYEESWNAFREFAINGDIENFTNRNLNLIQGGAYKGNPIAQNLLGHYYLRHKDWLGNENYSEPDYERAFSWFLKSADKDFVNSQRLVGLFYIGEFDNAQPTENQQLTERLEKAEHYFGLAANQNDKIALYFMGIINVHKDLDKAFEYWEKGAQLGEDRCMRCIETHTLPSDDIDRYNPLIVTPEPISVKNPRINRKLTNMLSVSSVTITEENTILELYAIGSYGQWIQINRHTYIVADSQRYIMERAEGITYAPTKTYFSGSNERIHFKLVFPPIPRSTTSIDLIEPNGSTWQLYGIHIQ